MGKCDVIEQNAVKIYSENFILKHQHGKTYIHKYNILSLISELSFVQIPVFVYTLNTYNPKPDIKI